MNENFIHREVIKFMQRALCVIEKIDNNMRMVINYCFNVIFKIFERSKFCLFPKTFKFRKLNFFEKFEVYYNNNYRLLYR